MNVLVIPALAAAVAVCAETAPDPVPLVADGSFSNGFTVLSPKAGRKVPTGTIQPSWASGPPAWSLAQWHSAGSLGDVSAERLPSGAHRWADSSKSVMLAREGMPRADLILGVDSRAEYPERPRRRDEPWIHLLASQTIDGHPRLVDCRSVSLALEYRLLREKRFHSEEDYVRNLHAAQFILFVTVQDRDRESPGYGDFLWFGVPLYDSRFPFPKPFRSPDQAHGKFIYSIAGERVSDTSAHEREWVTVDLELRSLMDEALDVAWERGFLEKSKERSLFRLGGMSIGWEVPGTFDVAVQVRDFRLEAVVDPADGPAGKAGADGTETP